MIYTGMVQTMDWNNFQRSISVFKGSEISDFIFQLLDLNFDASDSCYVLAPLLEFIFFKSKSKQNRERAKDFRAALVSWKVFRKGNKIQIAKIKMLYRPYFLRDIDPILFYCSKWIRSWSTFLKKKDNIVSWL